MSLKTKMKQAAIIALLSGRTLSSDASAQNISKNQDSNKHTNKIENTNIVSKTDTLEFQAYGKDIPTKTIDFRAFHNPYCDAYYDPAVNTITLSTPRLIDVAPDIAMNYIVHEQKHRDDNKLNLSAASMNLEQNYKLDAHKEIGANLCDLLNQRQSYIDNKDKEAFLKKEKSIFFSFYFDAIKDGKIDPLSEDPKDFKNEISFIANGMKDMWMESFANSYDGTFTANSKDFLGKRDFKELQTNDDTYQNGVNTIYTIGGINFFDYLEKDIECYNPTILQADKMISEKSEDRDNILNFITKKNISLEYPEVMMSDYDPPKNLSAEQKFRLIQHKSLVDDVIKNDSQLSKKISEEVYKDSKAKKSTFSTDFTFTLDDQPINPIDASFNQASKNMKESPFFKSKLLQYEETLINKSLSTRKDNKKVYEKELQGIYTINNTDIRPFLSNDIEDKIPQTKSVAIQKDNKAKRVQQFLDAMYNRIKDIGSTNKIVSPIKDELPNDYTGKPQYKDTDDVRQVKIIDFDKPFLQKHLNKLNRKNSVSKLRGLNKVPNKPIKKTELNIKDMRLLNQKTKE